MTPTLSTPRLDLIAGNLELASAERDNRKLFAELLNARVHEGWPPPLNDVQSLEYAIRYFHENGERDQWGVWYFVLRGQANSRALIGNGGFRGRPQKGTVELGYSIVEPHQKAGLGTELVAALVQWAFDHQEVSMVIAETLPELRPSIRVLERNGFLHLGQGSEPGVIRLGIAREAWEKL